ncbi:hypothetical protein BpHYR1_028981 [Brachionus plicatilis]|uniref:Uncharacterized protein n=1 Tax=Brachionus plicatilis TaxID=10195 RepID=A0A3M7RNZ0_BRAPC|nr:hypothetical protein BpHYR1_028981 [Brachionus plicatilis]
MTNAIIRVKVLENQTDLILQKVLQKFCGMIHDLNLSQGQSTKIQNRQIVDEFEIGEVIDGVFTYYNKPYLLKCEIISISISQNSQPTQSSTQVSLRSNRESHKRNRSESCIIETSQSGKKIK